MLLETCSLWLYFEAKTAEWILFLAAREGVCSSIMDSSWVTLHLYQLRAESGLQSSQ